eukprot:TRINITY_DN1058_c0_g1_i8.p3 TRINITY_DN1058_c0_g1~~TRINITY_DN1058_c0_g1_i8.p3  ORF type:complete len:174 (-),score=45.94 TRINITY_DN1058_c0_g1_i8:373-894(-)
MLRRYGERWIWLGDDLLSLNWKSKKRGVDMGRLNLTKVKKLKGSDRELTVEAQDGRRLVLTLATAEDAKMWLTGLSCLVPKKAKVTQMAKVLKERVNYDPLRDSWRGKPVAGASTSTSTSCWAASGGLVWQGQTRAVYPGQALLRGEDYRQEQEDCGRVGHCQPRGAGGFAEA